ncbi:peroxiredoxin [Prauserella sp. PE36]|uniref:Ohr family peroxiredoxin n=1 Tax=Prauserella sp. PE36 TaxID=1504709 RepID=UPI000D9FA82E|nr:Ohr family peroxiredoxin [Prauserella sp. PE36]PXY25890.1 peroxiredoxin [Prauserella coralliicola]RBM22212.1 peroxiredoxin [Prauserella sp. PE36]
MSSISLKPLYTATVEATGGRAGTARSHTGSLELTLARPAERGTGAGTDPEELFAAGYAACFASAVTVAARRERVRLGACTVTGSVTLGEQPDGRYAIAVRLEVSAPDCDPAGLRTVVATADTLCPYSNALREGAPVTIEIA